MKWTSGKLAVILLVLAAGWIGWNMAFPPVDKVGWQTDLESARSQSLEQNKPLLLYFTADWCGPCRYMKRSVFTDASVGNAMSNYVRLKIDVDEQPLIAREYQVSSIPAFVIQSSGGEIEKRAGGAMKAQELIEWLGADPTDQ